jgi:hypothetical protein
MIRRSIETAPDSQDEQGILPMRAPRRQADRVGKRNVGGQIDVRTARALAILAAKEDRTQIALLEEAIADLLRKYDQEV